jgi:predicted RNA-binding Zn-ribbon protein involved in translation (DUF1610 family)
MDKAMVGAAFWVAIAVFVFAIPGTAQMIPAQMKVPIVVGAFVLGFGYALTDSREYHHLRYGKQVSSNSAGEFRWQGNHLICPKCGEVANPNQKNCEGLWGTCSGCGYSGKIGYR